jgi:hypothetical protein
VATSTKDNGKMDMTNRAVPAVMTELRTINAMINSTKTMLIVSAVYCHARPESKKKVSGKNTTSSLLMSFSIAYLEQR